MVTKVSVVFQKNYDSTAKIVVNQGGTRSSKTYSVIQVLVAFVLDGKRNLKGKTITIVRKTLPSIKKTVYKDFQEILTLWDRDWETE